MRLKLSVLVLLCFFCSLFSNGQTRAIDSALQVINKTADEKLLLNSVLYLCEQRISLHSDTLLRYATIARSLAQKQDKPYETAMADYFIAAAMNKKGETDSAEAILNKEFPLVSEKYKKTDAFRKYITLKGQIMIKRSQYKEALSHFYQYLPEAEKNRDTLGMYFLQTNIGWVNMELGRNREALNWFYKSIAVLTPELERKFAVVFSNMAAVYNEMNQNDSAEFFINKAIQLDESTGDNLGFLANSYAIKSDIMVDTRRFTEAETSMNKALNIRKKIGDIFYVISDMVQMAIYYAHNQQTDKGIALCKEALQIAKKYKLNSKIRIIYEALAENYNAAADYKNHSAVLQTLLQYQDSVYKQNSARELASLQNKFELQRKENIIIQQKLDLSKKNFLFYSSLGLLLVAAAFGLLIFTSYKKRQRLKLQVILEREKQLSLNAVATAEENERKRIAADLHDNLGVYAASIASNIDHIDVKASAENLHLPLHELRKNSQEIVSQLGDTIWALKKDSLSLTAISDRIKSFIQRIGPSYPQISFDVTENIRNNQLLPPSQAFHLFRIIQEAINNAVKHSHCSHVNVEINGFSNWKVLVKDNGHGFDPEKNTGEHNGLNNMKKRCAEFKWQISWQDAQPGSIVTILPTTN